MDIVLDSDSLNHLLRCPRKSGRRTQPSIETAIDRFVAAGQLRLAVDPQRALIDEWGETCDAEIVQVLITQWEPGIVPVDGIGKFSKMQSKRLRAWGFDGGTDKLIVKIAIVTSDHVIVSEDSDFWDPKKKANFKNKNAPVARFLREEFGITIWLLGMLMPKLHAL